MGGKEIPVVATRLTGPEYDLPVSIIGASVRFGVVVVAESSDQAASEAAVRAVTLARDPKQIRRPDRA